ncbi:MAG: PDZ domain-containing protein [Gemmatimonadetes bacterium]|nr:PDZ domain-containing protein [Gemmatimonadota bacterium]NIO32311.1 PDZ domain-containing protein [Gemmatimonadota bacterium]
MRWIQLVLAGALVLAGVAEPVRAQEEEQEEKERERVCEWHGVATAPFSRIQVWPCEGDWPQVAWFSRQPRLGVWINTEANPETDRYGALIDRVADGSPAEKAGIQEGDIITKLGGMSLLEGDETYDEDESAPGMRLIERARELEDGDTVEVEFRRDGDTQTVELVAGEFEGPFAYSFRFTDPDSAFTYRFRMPDYERISGLAERLREIPEVRVRAPESFALAIGTMLPGLELVSLNPDLGEYFDADEGVLVISVPEESELGLVAGDVILEIDGRAVRDPSHAMRILRSYEPDEEVSFRIMRMKRETTVTGKISERGPHIIRERDER